MIDIHTFVFNAFGVNTYVLTDQFSKKCVIIDAACHTSEEKDRLTNFIRKNKLKPQMLLNTHCHIDHILGNQMIKDEFNLRIECHKDDIYLLHNAVEHANLFGFNLEPPPKPDNMLVENDSIKFGRSILNVLHVPGHSPGSLAFINENQKFVITGDALFHGSIGRTDLQGGDFDQLITSIKTKLLPLGDTFTIYPGHGDTSTIGVEKKTNPFLNGYEG